MPELTTPYTISDRPDYAYQQSISSRLTYSQLLATASTPRLVITTLLGCSPDLAVFSSIKQQHRSSTSQLILQSNTHSTPSTAKPSATRGSILIHHQRSLFHHHPVIQSNYHPLCASTKRLCPLHPTSGVQAQVTSLPRIQCQCQSLPCTRPMRVHPLQALPTLTGSCRLLANKPLLPLNHQLQLQSPRRKRNPLHRHLRLRLRHLLRRRLRRLWYLKQARPPRPSSKEADGVW